MDFFMSKYYTLVSIFHKTGEEFPNIAGFITLIITNQ